MRVYSSKGERVFYILNIGLLSIVGILTSLPFLHVIAQSLSSEAAVISNRVTFYPLGLQINTYKHILKDGMFLNAFKISLIVTVVGTVLSLAATSLTAYPLSKSDLKGRKLILVLFVFSWLFQPGIIPNYLLIKQLGMINNLGSLILPGMIAVFNMLVMKNFFEAVPDDLDEAAKIDGASNLRILFTIILPVSLPVMATMGLFYAVGYWNSYIQASIYISNPALKPLQLYLFELVTQSMGLETTYQTQTADIRELLSVTPQGVRAAAVVLSTLPILLVYPFLQKYFMKGLVIGAVKG